MVFFRICTIKILVNCLSWGQIRYSVFLLQPKIEINLYRTIDGKKGKCEPLFTHHLTKTASGTFFNIFLIMEGHGCSITLSRLTYRKTL